VLYEESRDGMVAFELAKLHEQAGNQRDAVEWYTMAWERFRRDSWRAKAGEALQRLGTPIPEGEPTESSSTPSRAVEGGLPSRVFASAQDDASAEESADEGESAEGSPVSGEEQPASAQSGPGGAAGDGAPRRGRRGRRGGRGRRRRGAAAHAPAEAAAPAAASETQRPSDSGQERLAFTPPARESREPRESRSQRSEPARGPVEWGPVRTPTAIEEGYAPPAMRGGPSRAGDPGMASRAAQLDSQLRRLIAASPHSLGETDVAPAGPGVFLLSDSELTTHYYIERCDTLRVALKFVSQGARGRERERSVKSRLAEQLDITEAQATKYMKEHCVVRWIQLDEGASHLAHYAIALLRPALNE